MPHVLIIEDNKDLRDLLQFILEGAGHSVSVASDGEAGLRAQQARPADIVITDIFMPNQDGLETIAHLRREHPQVKVVAMSGGGSRVKGEGTLLTAREIGAHIVLVKPFDNDELLGVVRSLAQ
jgi:DNA-binding response OmpR family regulator